MPRSYRHVKGLEREIYGLKALGKTNREISEQYGLSIEQVKSLVKRHNKTERCMKAGILQQRRGRPSKRELNTEDEKENEIRRLQMENELLRDFLRASGRR